MTKKKRKGLKLASYLVLLGFALVGLAIFGLWSNNYTSNNPATPLSLSNSPTPTKSLYTVDRENDGIYVNYQYGFSFNYPKETFLYFKPETNSGEVTGAVFRDNEEGYPGNLNLNVHINSRDLESEYFNKWSEMPVNIFEYSDEFLSDERKAGREYISNTMKIRNIKVEDVDGIVLFRKYIGGETEPTNGHSVLLLKDSKVFTVNVISPSGLNSDPFINERLSILNKIIDSFDFFIPGSLSTNEPEHIFNQNTRILTSPELLGYTVNNWGVFKFQLKIPTGWTVDNSTYWHNKSGYMLTLVKDGLSSFSIGYGDGYGPSICVFPGDKKREEYFNFEDIQTYKEVRNGMGVMRIPVSYANEVNNQDSTVDMTKTFRICQLTKYNEWSTSTKLDLMTITVDPNDENAFVEAESIVRSIRIIKL